MTANQTVCIVPGLNMGDPILEIRMPKDSPDLIIENRVEEGRVVEARFTLPAEAKVIQKPGVSATKEEMMLKAAGFESTRLGGPCCSFEEYTNPSKSQLMPSCVRQEASGLAQGIHNPQDPNGLPQHAPGAKNDAGKQFASLLLNFSRALSAVAEVATYGANKYTRDGWEHVPDGITRYRDAEWRHLLKGKVGECDPESGLPHAWHRLWNSLAALELELRQQNDENEPCAL